MAELPLSLDVYVECRLARLLSCARDLSWSSVQLALRACRLGEQAAAASLAGGSWTRAGVEAGDRLRWEGERRLAARVHAEDETKAVALLQRAVAEYEQVLATDRDVVATQRLVDEALFRLPDLFRRAIVALAGNETAATDPAPVAELLRVLALSLDLLDRPSAAGMADLRLRSQSTRYRAGESGTPGCGQPEPTSGRGLHRSERGRTPGWRRTLRRLRGWAGLYGQAVGMLAGDPSRIEQAAAVVAASRQLAMRTASRRVCGMPADNLARNWRISINVSRRRSSWCRNRVKI